MEEHRRLTQTIKTSSYPIDKKIAAIDELISMDSQLASLGICHACFVKNETLMKRSCKAIRGFSYSRFRDLINFILEEESADTRYARKKFLDLLYKLRQRDMLKYIVENASLLSADEQKRRIIAPWLRQSQAMSRLIKALFSMPPKTAKILGRILKQIDSGLTLNIAKIMKNAPPPIVLKGLNILQEISNGNEIAPFLMNLFHHSDQKVKSKVTLMLGSLSDKLMFVKTALQDGDSRVRANALEAIWDEDVPEVKKVFASHLNEKDNRARANAAMGLHQMGDERGFDTLMEMIHDKEKMMRASAAWAFGEVKEVKAINRLQTLQANDPEEIVRKNATIALEKMDAPLLRLLKYFAALGTRVPSLDESKPTAVKEFLAIARFLEDMNPEKQMEILETIKNISPETCTRMWETLEGVAPEEDMPLAFLMASLYSNDAQLRSESTKLLGEECDDELFFMNAMRSPDAIVRAKALEALWGRLELKPQTMEFALPILEKSLEDTDGKVAASAAIGFHKLNNPRGARTILNMLDDEDNALRANGAWAAGEITLIKSKGRLVELQKDPLESVRRNATEALQKINDLLERQEAKPIAINIRINHLDISEMSSSKESEQAKEVKAKPPLPRSPGQRRASEETGQALSPAHQQMVWCFVSVLDNRGRIIEKLSKENFALAENNIPIDDYNFLPPSSNELQGDSPKATADGSDTLRTQPSASANQHKNLPTYRSSVAIVMDYSESMAPEDTKALEKAASVFVSQMSDSDRGAIIKFSGEVSVAQPFTDDKKLLTDAIRSDYKGKNNEGTVLYDSIYAAVQLISGEKDDKTIIVLTDGDDIDSDKSMEDLMGFANKRRTAIHTIGLGEDLDAGVLRKISNATGGNSYLAKDQSNLINTYKSISEKLTRQYILSYMRKTSQTDGIATLQVEVKYGDLKAKDAIPLKTEKTRG